MRTAGAGAGERVENTEEIPPERLYKYYSPDGIEKVLSNNTLRWALPCEENDPFEALASGWDLEAVEESCPEFHPEQTPIIDGYFNARQAQKKVSHITSFVSFTEYPESVLMWAHYADNHNGACLQFNVKLIQRIDCIECVKYVDPDEVRDRYPLPHSNQKDDSPEYQKQARAFLAKKSKDWAYEAEWRLIVPPMADFIRCEKADKKYILVSDIPQGAITKLIFGCNVPISTRLAWAKQVLIKHPKCKFAAVVPTRNTYELEIEALALI